MPSSAAIQQVQLVAETSYGVTPGAPAYKRLNDVKIVPTTTFDTENFSPSGVVVPALIIVNDEFTEGGVEGALSFTGTGYPLSSLFGAPTTTTPTGGTTSKQHLWSWDGKSEPTPRSYTMEYGDAAFADRVAGVFFNSLTFGGGRQDGLDFGSAILGKPLTEGQTLTVGATDVPAKPVSALQMDVFLDNTWAALGTTKLLQAYNVPVEIADRYDRTRPINSTKSSDGLVQLAGQEHTVQTNMAVDAVSKALYATMRNGTKKFIRVLFTGPIIEGAIPYTLQMDACVLPTGTDGYAEYNGLHAIQWNWVIARDDVSGNCLSFKLVNLETAY